MTVLLLAVAVPGLLAIAWLGWRLVQSTPLARSLALARGADARGIALQTVIIIVVLLAIAGAVAGVLLQRGGEATSQLEDTDVVQSIYTYRSESLCKAVGGEWRKYKTTDKPATDEAGLGTLTTSDSICVPTS